MKFFRRGPADSQDIRINYLAGVIPSRALKLDGKSFVPSLRGDEDPFKKRSWIYSQTGDFRMIRDWYHIIDNKGAFRNLLKAPRQEEKVNPQDEIAPGRRQRLQMILDRFPKNAPAPAPFS